jgi:hypothetical protein
MEFSRICAVRHTYLEGLAAVEVDLGEPAWAVRLLGNAAEWRERISTLLLPVYRARYEQAVAASRAVLSEEAFEAAWAEGRDRRCRWNRFYRLPTPVNDVNQPGVTSLRHGYSFSFRNLHRREY